MTTDQDQAKLIAERVARRLKGTAGTPSGTSNPPTYQNGSPVRQELSAIREGLHDLENKLERIESKIVQGATEPTTSRRARVIDFVSSGPPLRSSPTITSAPESVRENPSQFVPPTQSPWLSSMSSMYRDSAVRAEKENPQSAIRNPQSVSHPSQERFGVEEAAVSELVEFFESEKKCSLDPSGKPCDHCEMCSSRGF